MRDMAHSICLIKLYQITMRKKFRFFVSDYLKSQQDTQLSIWSAGQPAYTGYSNLAESAEGVARLKNMRKVDKLKIMNYRTLNYCIPIEIRNEFFDLIA